MSETRTIEINGVKLEVDLTTAKRIDTFQIGSNVKVLHKNSYGSPIVRNGVVVGFLVFKDLPTIQIVELNFDYNSARIEFVNYNADSKDIDVVGCSPHELELEKSKALELFEKEIHEKELQLDDLKNKRDWFVKFYGKYFNKEA